MYRQMKMIQKCCLVSRFHTDSLVIGQNDGEHSFNCALMVYLAANKLGLNGELCSLYMLTHDMGEQEYGDAPGHIKHLFPDIGALEDEWVEDQFPQLAGIRDRLTGREQRLCHFFDKFECLLICRREKKMGNENLDLCHEKLVGVCLQLATDSTEDQERGILLKLMEDFQNDT